MNGFYDELRLAFHGVWRRRWIALAAAWGIALIGWLVVSQLPNRYESRAKVFVQLASVLPSKIGISTADQQRDIDTIRQTLTSAVNLEKVVRGTDLADTATTPKAITDRVAGLQQSIKIVAEQDNLFSISATADSPKLAKQIVTKLISIFVDQNMAGDRDEVNSSLQFLESQLAQRQKELQDADAKRTEFQAKYLGSLPGTGSIQDRLSAARSQMSEVDSDLAAATSSLAAVNGQMAGVAATVPGGPGSAGSAGPMRARLATLEGQLADAYARGFTDSHPDVVALKAQIAQARSAAAGEPLVGGSGGGGDSANPMYLSLRSMQADRQAQVAALVAKKEQLQRDLDQLTTKLTGDPQIASEMGEIDRNYQGLKDQYDKLLASREEVRVRAQAQAQTDQVKFSVIDPPTLPTAPAISRPLLSVAVLFVALLGGTGVAFALGQLRATFPTAARLEKATGLPVIGSISQIMNGIERDRRRRDLRRFAVAGGGLAIALGAVLGMEMLMRGLSA